MRQLTVAAMAAITMLAASAGLAGCASEGSSSSVSATPAGGGGGSASAAAASCSNSAIQSQLYAKGMLTVATDKPVYPPWFVNNKPTNGQGYESAVAYAVAAQLGFKPSQVTWAYEPFDNSYAPGPKSSTSTSTRSPTAPSGPRRSPSPTATTTSSRRWWR